MRRFFSLLMCVSGMSLAVTASQADEPTPPPVAEHKNSSALPRELPTPHADAPDAAPTAAEPTSETRQQLDQLLQRARDLSRRQMSDAELAAQIQRLVATLHSLSNRADSLARTLAGKAHDRAQVALNDQIAVVRASLEELEAEAARRAETAQSAESRADRLARSLAERTLTEAQQAELRAMIRKLRESATSEARSARVTIEGQLDELEHFLAERREQRIVRPDEARPDAERSEPVARLRHLNAAVEHLEAAGLHDVAMNVREHAQLLQRKIERQRVAEALQRKSAQRAAAEQPALDDERRPLNEQVRELRREVRRLRAEMDQLRQDLAPAEKPTPSDAE